MDAFHDIAKTASLVNESRHRRVDISHDRFAGLWVEPSTTALWDEMAREVYPFDDIELSLRNRFFLERLRYFVRNGVVRRFVNVGAGFTSYPFLLTSPCPSAEIDLPHVIHFKRARIRQWQKGGYVPSRRVKFISADVTSPSDVEALRQSLRTWLGRRRSFVLMEGLSYYLTPFARNRLFTTLGQLQTTGSIFALDYWTGDMLNHPVTRRWRRYLARKGWHRENDYYGLSLSRLASLKGYELVELADIQTLENVYTGEDRLADARCILPEKYAILVKTA